MYKDLILTEREKRILRLLLENKVMTRKHIAKQIFPNLDTGNITHRLYRILELGFVKDFQDRRFSKYDIIYELTGEGIAIAKSLHDLEFDRSPTRSYAKEHDLGLSEIRQLLQSKSTVANYFPENVLQCCPLIREQAIYKPFVDVMSDAILSIRISSQLKNGALEFEPTGKWIERYKEKLLNYYIKEEIDFVLYVCTSGKTIETIQSVENEIKPKGKTKIYFSLLENVLKQNQIVTFQGRNQSLFQIS